MHYMSSAHTSTHFSFVTYIIHCTFNFKLPRKTALYQLCIGNRREIAKKKHKTVYSRNESNFHFQWQNMWCMLAVIKPGYVHRFVRLEGKGRFSPSNIMCMLRAFMLSRKLQANEIYGQGISKFKDRRCKWKFVTSNV